MELDKDQSRVMMIIRRIREEEYRRGYHDGMIKGDEKGFNRGIKRGITEIEKLYQ
jgi:hypothetical protein